MSNKSDENKGPLAAAADIPIIQHSALLYPGSHSKRPFRIVALCLDRALGDFAVSLCFAASVKQLFEHASLAVYFHDDRKYKATLLKACHQIDTVIPFDGENPLPVESFDTAFGRLEAPYPDWYANNFHFADLILTPTMMVDRYLYSFEQPARLQIPPEEIAKLESRLIDAGVKRDRWFSVIHYREPNYGARSADPLRDTDPLVVQGVTHDLIDELGGQVVRVGHPAMTPFTARDGFIDLAPAGDNDFMLQLFAMSRARFMIAGASGPHDCSAALGTPTGVFAGTSYYLVWNPQDAQLHSHIFTPQGHRIAQELTLQRGMHPKVVLEEYLRRGYRLKNSTQAEISEMANHLLKQTMDTPGWRTHWYEKPFTKPNFFRWPLPVGSRSQTLSFPEFAPQNHEADLKLRSDHQVGY